MSFHPPYFYVGLFEREQLMAQPDHDDHVKFYRLFETVTAESWESGAFESYTSGVGLVGTREKEGGGEPTVAVLLAAEATVPLPPDSRLATYTPSPYVTYTPPPPTARTKSR